MVTTKGSKDKQAVESSKPPAKRVMTRKASSSAATTTPPASSSKHPLTRSANTLKSFAVSKTTLKSTVSAPMPKKASHTSSKFKGREKTSTNIKKYPKSAPSSAHDSSDDSVAVVTPPMKPPPVASLVTSRPSLLQTKVSIKPSYSSSLSRQQVIPLTLASFGITPADPPVSRLVDKHCTLKCCVIRGPEKTGLVFRLQPSHPDPTWNCWTDKVMFDCMRERRQWVLDFSIHSTIMKWYHNDLPMKNIKGYCVRLYVIFSQDTNPRKESIIRLGEAICNNLNESPGMASDTQATLIVDDFFWGGDEAVWADVLGMKEALSLLKLATRTSYITPGYYEANRDVIHSYFHDDQLPSDLFPSVDTPIFAETEPYNDTDPSMACRDYTAAELEQEDEENERSRGYKEEKSNDDEEEMNKGKGKEEEEDEDSYYKYKNKHNRKNLFIFEDETEEEADSE